MDEYERRLRRLVYQAHDLKKSPYFTDACQAIVDLHERRQEVRDQQKRDPVGAFHPFALACLLRSIYHAHPGTPTKGGP